jgi:hypothetical protein
VEFLRSVLDVFHAEMITPPPYGWFHILSLVIMIGLSVLLCTRFRNVSHETIRKSVFWVSFFVFVLEVYKQIVYTFSCSETGIDASFQWYAFPFQFCSTPMYAGMLLGIFRKGRIHDALSAYLASFSIFAGLCVMAYPGDVFISLVGINIQTMICHGSMVVLGAWLLASGYVKVERRYYLKALCVFAVCICIAMILNEVAHLSGLLETHTFNMFFISPYCEPSLPVYSLVQQVIPFPLCTIIYFVAFSLAALLMMLAAQGIRLLATKKTTSKAAPL